MVDLGLPELSTEQIEELCATAEQAAHNYVHSKVSPKMVEALNISVEAEGQKPLNLSVEVDLFLTKEAAKTVDVKALVKEAIDEAYRAIEEYLRKLK